MAGRPLYTKESFNAKLKEVGREDLLLIDEYKNGEKHHKFRCLLCGNEWSTGPSYVLKRGIGCPPCGQKKKGENRRAGKLKDIEERCKAQNIKLISPYLGMRKRHDFKCLTCGEKFNAIASQFLNPTGSKSGMCPNCSQSQWMTKQEKRRLDPNVFAERLKEAHPHNEPLNEYKNSKTKISFRCSIHETIWEALPLHVLKERAGCPDCVDLIRGTDSIQAIINGNIRDGNKPCSLYLFELKNYPGFQKIGIANDIERRARESDGEYGECLASWEFDTRIEAILVEAVALQETKTFKASPEKLDKENYEGITEIRKMDPNSAIEYIQGLVDEANETGACKFAADRLDLPKSHKKQLLEIDNYSTLKSR